ncbi:MAG TPA: autotransporter domain-containing protein, partial [Gammaproteobacteria bacterium]|nr:autotransporter domain-containing protein [Gammaproteobacteria bacterium]
NTFTGSIDVGGTNTGTTSLNSNVNSVVTLGSTTVTNVNVINVAGTLTAGGAITGVDKSVNVSGELDLNSTMSGTAATGGVTITGGGKINVNSGGSLNITGAFANAGNINVEGAWTIPASYSGAGAINVNANGTLTNNLTGNSLGSLNIGTTSLGTPTASNLNYTGSITNIPTITVVTSGTNTTLGDSTHNITGITTTLSTAQSTTLTLNGNVSVGNTGSFSNAGTTTIATGKTLSLTGGLNNTSTGKINVAGTFVFNAPIVNTGKIYVYGAGATLTNAASGTGSAELNVGSDSTGALYSGTNYSTSSTISMPIINATAGTFTINNAVSNVTAFSISSGVTTLARSSITGASSSSTFSNAGTLTFSNTGPGSINTFASISLVPTSTSILNIETGGTFDLHNIPITGTSVSTGSNSTTMNIGAVTATDVTNPGAISFLTNLTIGDGGTTSRLTTTTTIANIVNLNVKASSFLILNAASASQFGTVSNVTNFVVNGTLTIGAGASFSMEQGSTITGTGALCNSGSLSVNGVNLTSSLSLVNTSTGTFTINGQPTLNFTGNKFINNGNIIIAFSENNTLPNIITAATVGSGACTGCVCSSFLDLSHGNITIQHNSTYIAENTYTFLTASNAGSALTTAQQGVAILPQPTFYISNWQLSSTYVPGTGALLQVQVTRDGFDQHALTPQTQAIGAYLESIGSSGTTSSALIDLLNALEKIQNDYELTLALESLVPPQYTMLVTLDRLDSLFGYIDMRLAKSQQGYAAGDIPFDKTGFWVRPFYSNGTQATTPTLQGFSDKTHGWLAGLDKTISNHIMLGFAASISKTSVVQTDSPATTTNINNYDLSFYGVYRTDNDVYVDGLISGGVSNYHGLRTLILPGLQQSASSNYSSQQLTFKVMGSRPFILDFWQFTPRAVAQYSFVRQLSYTEDGLGAYDNFVDPDNINLFRLGFGAALGIPMSGAGMTSIPSAYAMMFVDAKGGADTVNTMFVSGGPVLTNVAQQSRLLIKLGVMYELAISDRLQFAIDYAYDMRRGFQGHEGFINLRYVF